MAQASIDATVNAINGACRKRGGTYASYSCKVVSWDDVQRGTVGGGLSCWGANITDTRLWAKDGKRLVTVRSDNWNEKLGKVSADKIALLVGNHKPNEPLKAVSLQKLLKEIRTYGGYAGVDVDDISDAKLDQEISVRFQTVFLPVYNEDKSSMEFAPEAYNYFTMSDDDPRNLLLLCTTQGTAIQQDGAGAKRLYHHRVDDHRIIHRHWLEAERSEHKVGGPQNETKEEREDAAARGKATAELIGLESLGSRFNVLMTIQVPLEQKKHIVYIFDDYSTPLWLSATVPESATPRSAGMRRMRASSAVMTTTMSTRGVHACALSSCSADSDDVDSERECSSRSSHIASSGKSPVIQSMDACYCSMSCPTSLLCEMMSGVTEMSETASPRSLCASLETSPVGQSNAARVSRGSEEDTWGGLSVSGMKRHPSEHITVTVVIYNTVAGGVPSEGDVIAAIDDLEYLYKSCDWTGRLADDGAGFMKSELTVKNVQHITKKIVEKPHPDFT